MDRYESNLSALQQRQPQLARALANVATQRYSVEPSRSGAPTLILHQDGQNFYLHSRFKPVDEALKIIRNVDLETDHIIVLGLGLGYHLQAVLEHKNPKSRVLLLEPDLEIVKHSLHLLDWSKLMERDDFFYCFGSDMNLISSTVSQFIDVVSFERLGVVPLPSEVRFNETFFNEAKEKADNEIRTLLYDFKTRLAEDAMVPRNILKNIHGIINTRPLKSLKDRFTGKPCIIVSAGPSLDKNILYLKKARDRAVILCVDTALKPLLKRGIHPHFTVTADPSYKNYLHLQGTEEDIEYFLLADTGVSTKVFEDFNDHIFSVSLGKPIIRMIEQNIGEIGELEAWGSVISLALNFAIYLGCDPIVFLGQDFAFTDMRNHCRGTSWEDTSMEYHRDLDQLQRKEKQAISGIAKMVEREDVYGRNIMTSDRLLLYKNYLAQALTSFQGRTFINSTEGGILTDIPAVPLRRVLEQYVYSGESIDFSALWAIPAMANPQTRKQLLKFFKAKSGFFRKYKRKLEDSITQLARLDTLSHAEMQSRLQAIEKVKEQLYNNVANGELVEMWTQAPIYDFLKRAQKLDVPASGFDLSYGKQLGAIFSDYFNKLMPVVSGIIDSFDSSIQSLQGNRDLT